MTQLLRQVSDSVTMQVANASPLLTAIRIGPNRHLTGFLWRGDLLITSDQALPAAAQYSVVLSNGTLISAHAGPRDSVHDLAAIWLDTPSAIAPPAPARSLSIGSLVLVLGADFDGSPTVRLTTIFGFPRTAGMTPGGAPITLDLPGGRASPGCLVLDADGLHLGMAAIAPSGDTVVVPHGVIARFVDSIATREPHLAAGPTGSPSPALAPALTPAIAPAPAMAPGAAQLPMISVSPVSRTAIPPTDEQDLPRPAFNGPAGNGHTAAASAIPAPLPIGTPLPVSPDPSRDPPRDAGRRGWLGLSLQPITVPDGLVSRAGQPTARQVVGITRGGPADRAGLRAGDVLLAVDGTATTGPNTLRTFLQAERIGSEVEVRLMRDGMIHTAKLMVAAQPA